MAKTPKETDTDLKEAQAVGHLKTMPEFRVLDEKVPEPGEVIDDPDSFRAAIGHAQMLEEVGEKHVFVSERLFNFLLKQQAKKSRYFTYGNPGIKVYREGTKESNDDIDNMSALDYHEYAARQKKTNA